MNVEETLAKATFYTDNDPYVLVKLPANAVTVAAGIIAEIGESFTVLVVDKDEVSLVIPQEAVNDFGNRLRGQEISKEPYRLITVDVVFPLDVFGVMSRLTGALAAANIPVFPYASYSRDHLLVPAAKFDQAMAALNKLKGK